MPLYEFKCGNSDCSHNEDYLEVMRCYSDAVAMEGSTCPTCGKGELTKVMSKANHKFVGTGFYVNDYGGRKPK